MRVAIISDLHGNAVALEKVLEEIKKAGAEKLIIAGDFTGYYYEPDKVFNLLNSWEWQGVIGNHDKFLRDFGGKKDLMADYRASYGRALEVALEKLGEKEKQLLFSLPEKRELDYGGKRILVCHGAPWQNDEYIYPNAKSEVFERIAGLGYDFVILGHTHYPMVKKIGKTIIINPGSVGQPRDEGGNSSWALVDFANGQTEIFRTQFNPNLVIKEIEFRDPQLPYLKEVLTRSKK